MGSFYCLNYGADDAGVTCKTAGEQP